MSSLTDQKKALFGKGPIAPSNEAKSSKGSIKAALNTVPTISPALKQKKIVDAEEFKTKALNALKTSVRQLYLISMSDL